MIYHKEQLMSDVSNANIKYYSQEKEIYQVRVIQRVKYDIAQGTTNVRFIKCKYKVSLTRKPNTSGKMSRPHKKKTRNNIIRISSQITEQHHSTLKALNQIKNT